MDIGGRLEAYPTFEYLGWRLEKNLELNGRSNDPENQELIQWQAEADHERQKRLWEKYIEEKQKAALMISFMFISIMWTYFHYILIVRFFKYQKFS